MAPENSLPVFTFGPYNHHKNGLLAGGSVEISVSDFLSVETGLFYSQAGGSTTKMVGTDEQGTELGKFWFVQDLRYIELPVHMKASYQTKFFNTFILADPNLGFLLSASEKFKSDYDAPEFEKLKYDIKGSLAKYNFGIDLGLGVSYPFSSRVHLSVVTKYTIGLINQIKSGKLDGTQRSSDFKIMTGLIIGL